MAGIFINDIPGAIHKLTACVYSKENNESYERKCVEQTIDEQCLSVRQEAIARNIIIQHINVCVSVCVRRNGYNACLKCPWDHVNFIIPL